MADVLIATEEQRAATIAAFMRAYEIAMATAKEYGPLTAYGAVAAADRIKDALQEMTHGE